MRVWSLERNLLLLIIWVVAARNQQRWTHETVFSSVQRGVEVPFLYDSSTVWADVLLVRNFFFLVAWIVAVGVRKLWRNVISFPSANRFVFKLFKIKVDSKLFLHVL